MLGLHVAARALLAGGAAAAPAPSSWTFAVVNTYGTGPPTGHTGTQTFSSGGLADTPSTSGNASYWGTQNGGGTITADFGESKAVSQVHVGGFNYEGWTPSYANGALVEASTDGTSWTTLFTTSGHTTDTPTQHNVSVTARYIRASIGSGYIAFGTLKFV